MKTYTDITNKQFSTADHSVVRLAIWSDMKFTFKFGCKGFKINFSVDHVLPDRADELIEVLRYRGYGLTNGELTMIYSFVNKSGDMLVRNITGYEINGKKGVAMTVVGRGGMVAVYTFGYSAFYSKKNDYYYGKRTKLDHYGRYSLGVAAKYESCIVLKDSIHGEFEIMSQYDKTPYDYYRVKVKVPKVLEPHESHVECRAKTIKKLRDENDQLSTRLSKLKTKVRDKRNRHTIEERKAAYDEYVVTLKKRDALREYFCKIDAMCAGRLYRGKNVALVSFEEMAELTTVKEDIQLPNEKVALANEKRKLKEKLDQVTKEIKSSEGMVKEAYMALRDSLEIQIKHIDLEILKLSMPNRPTLRLVA
ncbi:hypothetical protein Q2854_004301 [Escherichia coli]|nr:hypothetical protein [Escherichia coli]EHP9912600.1 hypothetical protein [Escherichia coli]ELM6022807.1 hypothetical protein [Escherichia coli]ELM6033025.1 hypothetical protein [Escherichia coli]ELM6098970.1 hypothetical protein [Escherichia coli]